MSKNTTILIFILLIGGMLEALMTSYYVGQLERRVKQLEQNQAQIKPAIVWESVEKIEEKK